MATHTKEKTVDNPALISTLVFRRRTIFCERRFSESGALNRKIDRIQQFSAHETPPSRHIIVVGS